MNKTLTINLSGLVFNIDENAYELLRNYLDKLRRRFTGSSGEEIITDIESRIAEMFQERISPGKNVIIQSDVESVIAIMGNPEDIAGEEKKQESSYTFNIPNVKVGKRFFRNPDDKILGGVCGGISAYFDIDPIWLRLSFALLFWFFFTGLVLYIILWLIIPKAKTSTEKLEMRGEQINISNIEKNIREEMESVRKRVKKFGKEINTHENRSKIKSATDKVIDFIKDVLMYAFKFIRAILGFALTVFSLFSLIVLAIAVFSIIGWIPVFSTGFPSDFIHFLITPKLLWLSLTGLILLIGIPFIVLLINGIKLLFRVKLNLKNFGVVMLVFWFIGIGFCVPSAIMIANEYKSKATVSESVMLPVFKSKTISVKTNKISNARTKIGNRIIINGSVMDFSEIADSVLCSDVRLDIDQSRNDSVYLTTEYSSRGKTTDDARSLAKKITYSYSVNDSSIIFNNALNINNSERWRVQAVRLTLKIPVGYSVILDQSLQDIIYDSENVTNTVDYDMINHTWKMTTEGLKCLDCKDNEKKMEIIIPETDEKEKTKKHEPVIKPLSKGA